MTTTVVPESPEELTPEYLSEVLGTTIEAVVQTELGDGKGFMGDILRLDLSSTAPGAPASIVAKLPKKANRPFGEMIGIYEREILFYRDLADAIPARTPGIIYSFFDPDPASEKQKQVMGVLDRLPQFLAGALTTVGKWQAGRRNRRYIVLMEDLGHLEIGDQLAGTTPERCQLVLEEIAATHRSLWDANLDDYFWLMPIDIDAKLRHGMFRKSLPIFKKRIGDRLDRELAWLDRNGTQLARTFAADAPATLLHNDLRLDNICFDATDGGTHCVFIDWQLVRSGPAVSDIAYFLGGALVEDTPAADVDDLLHAYHRALDRSDYTFEQLQRDYRRALFLNLATLTTIDQVDVGADRGADLMDRWIARLITRLDGIDPTTLL